ncbi:MAG: phospholipase A [Muribaculaceae bacterium]|nr:phospholipase A [Muribaculaceae bacterium]MDE7343721.1 phospholipase A [Muribaculaceae bacterium]
MTDSIKKEFDYGPFFGLYKDNYFTVGSAVGQKPSALNSDVKFQISLSIRLSNATLPWNTYLYLFYTQLTFWNVFQDSMPMRDMNFNPGIGWTKPFFSKDRYIGKMTLIVEHESNGRDGDESRSWNRVALAGSAVVTDWLMVHGKFWIPIIDSMNNKDILRYAGLFRVGFTLTSRNKRWQGNLSLVKRKGNVFNWNTIAEVSWKVSEKANVNLFAQYYNGYGENLLDYNQFHSRLRVGLVFKPHLFSDY